MTAGSDGSGLPALLAECGFAAVGDPPSTTLDLLGRAVHVVVRGGTGRVAVEVRMAGGPPPVPDLDGHTLAAPGDTTFEADGHDLVGRRTLIAPTASALHDAVHGLAKALVRMGGVRPTVPPPSPAGGDTPVGPAPAPTPAPPPVTTPVTTPAPAVGLADSWCFVDGPTDLRAEPDGEDVVARLMPGVWYRATADDGTWVRVRHTSGIEGVVRRTEVIPG